MADSTPFLRSLHVLHGAHDVVGRLEVLHDAVLELFLLSGRELIAGVATFKSALAAHAHHRVDELSIALHGNSLLIHVCLNRKSFV